MKRLWAATDGIRYLMACFLVISAGLIYIVGCGGGSSESAEGGVAFEAPSESWEEETATIANRLCARHEGVQQILPYQEGEGWTKGFLVVICKDGKVEPWE